MEGPSTDFGIDGGSERDLQRAIWRSSADAIALTAPEGRVLMANPAYFQLFGFTPDQVIGRSFALIFPPEGRARAEEQYRAVFASAVPAPCEATVRRADGTERVVEARIDFVTDRAGRRTAMVNS